MVIFVLVISALLRSSCCSAENKTEVNLPDDQNDSWEALYKVIQSNQGGRSSGDLSAFDRILLANAEARAHGRSFDNFLYQGDIVMDKNEVIALITGGKLRRKRAVMKKDSRRLWRENIPYFISSNLGAKAVRVIHEAIQEWENTLPCLGSWTPINISKVPRSYIRFIKGKGCYSKVGRTGRRQEISVGEKCDYRGVVVHEIGHALGFWHEHSRVDRDKFVKIEWENILPEMRYNFEKYSSSKINDLGVGYDYESIMHYGPKAFSKDGRSNTISLIKGKTDGVSVRLGQRSGLSKKDKKQAQLLYGCTINVTNCKDLQPSCKSWANAGYCYNIKYKRYMDQKCCKSCLLFQKVSSTPSPLPCSSSPCLNSGVCSNQGSTFRCNCPSSHTGQRCEIKKNPCNSSPCLNGGVCSNHGSTISFKCKCPSSHSGIRCQQKNNPCNSSPCLNGGGCSNQGSKYKCNCPSSHNGQRCEIKNNPCNSSPCFNGGGCINQGSKYKCNCPSSHNGQRCEKKSTQCVMDLHIKCKLWTQFCSPSPKNKYYRFMQKRCCQTCKAVTNPNNPCNSSPCLNGGGCSNQGSKYKCNCPSSHNGQRCEIKNCSDKNAKQCLRWKQVGYCKGKYENYMTTNCAKSCGKC